MVLVRGAGLIPGKLHRSTAASGMMDEPPNLPRSTQMMQHVVELLAEPLPDRFDADPETLRLAAEVLAEGLDALEPVIDAINADLYRADGGDPLERLAALARDFDAFFANCDWRPV
jgi:hypothetical protein